MDGGDLNAARSHTVCELCQGNASASRRPTVEPCDEILFTRYATRHMPSACPSLEPSRGRMLKHTEHNLHDSSNDAFFPYGDSL